MSKNVEMKDLQNSNLVFSFPPIVLTLLTLVLYSILTPKF